MSPPTKSLLVTGAIASALLMAAAAMTISGCSTPTPQQDEVETDTNKAMGGLGLGAKERPLEIEPTMAAVESVADKQLGKESAQCRQHEAQRNWAEAASCHIGTYRDHKKTQNGASEDLTSPRLGAITLKASANFARAGDDAKAQMTRLYFLKENPAAPLTPTVLVLSADDYAAHGAPAKASKLYRGYISSFPDGHLIEYVESKCEALDECLDAADTSDVEADEPSPIKHPEPTSD